MNNRQRILRLLADGKWHSGEELATGLGVSRAAVWKQLGVLKSELGIDLQAVRGRGYRLAGALELLDEAAIRAALSEETASIIPEIEIHDTLASTSSHLMEQPADKLRSGHVCVSERQTAGRGRRGRSWVSPFGRSVYLSLFWRYGLAPAELSGISLAAGIAVIRSLHQLGIADVGLKWPNDILYQQQKLAGLLLEVSGEQSGPSRVVLGLGLNVKLPASDAEAIDQPWVDLSRVPGGEALSRNRLVASLLDNLVKLLSQFERNGFSALANEWQAYDLYHGKRVRLQIGERQIEGFQRGVDASGALLLETAQGVQTYHGGEVSLRPA